MEIAEKAARLVFPGFQFGVDDPQEALDLAASGAGGFCLYGGKIREIAEFTARLRERASNPLLFCADYEDGVYSQCGEGTPLSSNMGLGASGSEILAYQKGAITALEARAMGVRWVLAPVMDLATRPENPIVNTRSFASDPAAAIRLGRAYLKGLASGECLSCLKHFPGHGETLKDSHLELPLVKVSRRLLENRELAPFRELAAEADSVMTGHLAVPAFEKNRKIPYSLSRDGLKTLRKRLGFAGLVATDALNMKAVAGRFDDLEAASMALLGGADILLVPPKPRELIGALGAAVEKNPELARAIEASSARLSSALSRAAGAVGGEPADLDLVGCRKHRETADRMAEACLAWARGPAADLPARRVCYWEPEAAEGEWLGRPFVEALRAAGVEVRPLEGDGPRPGEILVVGSFVSPRAYTGRIAYSAQELRRIRAALAGAGSAVMISFGNPFVAEAFKIPVLCAFSRNEPAQKAAAGVLSGRLEAKGRLPVALAD